ncbi:hypothetical protein VPNG_02815 [Cytospora leucostoma]|uniref:Uncharacterized protein n=1 Tax=Cytospora leucostoma TaxID=1230097 RepID=A0A423XJC7_9PEZI|nr:hypothetical protein VPNG_02815 [Cytospora leucostoma]
MSQCVSCNNQPNDNGSLGGGPASEGAVTPVVIGIIVGTVAIFILVLCALFYCVKLENERSMRVKDDEENEVPSSSETGHRSPAAIAAASLAPMPTTDHQHNRFGPKPAGDIDLDRGRRLSSVTVVAGRESRAGVAVGAVVGKTRGLFGWGGKKRGSGDADLGSSRQALADNSPVTAIEMV